MWSYSEVELFSISIRPHDIRRHSFERTFEEQIQSYQQSNTFKIKMKQIYFGQTPLSGEATPSRLYFSIRLLYFTLLSAIQHPVFCSLK